MARLPQPGGDNGNWGDILNDFLRQAHKASGKLEDNSVTANTIAPGAVTKTTVGLGNVDNTSDVNKPISSATQTALDAKADASALAAKLNIADLDSQTAAKILSDGTATQAALTASYVKIQAELSPWYAALSKRASRRANVIVLGASLSEGFPASSYDLTIEQQLAALLRERFPSSGVAGGRGFVGIPTQGTLPALNTPWTIAGGAIDPVTVGAPEVFHIGPNRNGWYTNGSGTVTFQCSAQATALDLHHVKGASGGATGGYYKINGGAAVPFSTLNGSTVAAILRITVPASASVEFGCNAGGSYIIVAGVQEYGGDENQGIQVHNAGHSGYTATKWADSPIPGGWRDALALLNPDLIIIPDLGPNDGNSQGATPRSAAQFQADLTTFISTLRAGSAPLTTVPILLGAAYDTTGPGSGSGMNFVDSWSAYVAAIAAVASADPTLGFLDLSNRMPTTAADTVGIYYSDKVHGNADGSAYGLMARHFLDAVSP